MSQVTALLTGRGNNTLADKNVKQLLGRPLLSYGARAGKQAQSVTAHFASSEDPKILAAAEAEGYAPIRRPDALAAPTARHVDALLHGMAEIQQRTGATPEILVVILANAPTILPQWIDQSVQMLLSDPELTAVAPVVRDQDHHPFRAKTLREDGLLGSFFDHGDADVSSNRQDLPPCFFLCHNFWTLRAETLLNGPQGEPPWGFMGQRVASLEIPQSIDVHEPEDLLRAEKWLRENGVA
ncbi:hypothetical protein [Magnetofaba australis]|uniref:Putative CMP-N-acetylneuraminic acid synthetase-like protein n=1 Tax=Magnetofaba australis IT-1 TaxID=1434232 RepID=A0A1Y2K622_9PROT|nr:hypothetical protein [Magnetofaba australis]OSM04798.1 putative CMP-N-acetylneuraminic acid synthetase-like protein [Magnetofaba australis IT-1]